MLSLWIMAACASWGAPAEVKLMISQQSHAALVRELQLAPSNVDTEGRVYFLDNQSQELLSHGTLVRVRLRSGGADVTVKLRPVAPAIEGGSWGPLFECETDVTGSGAARSCAIKEESSPDAMARVVAAPRPQRSWPHLVTPNQARLIGAVAGEVLRRSEVWAFGPIAETKWKVKVEGTKLTVDRWALPTGIVIYEVSMKSKESKAIQDRSLLLNLMRSRGIQVLENSDNKSEGLLRSPENQRLWH